MHYWKVTYINEGFIVQKMKIIGNLWSKARKKLKQKIKEKIVKKLRWRLILYVYTGVAMAAFPWGDKRNNAGNEEVLMLYVI